MLVSFKAIGRNIRAARTALDITQEEAAAFAAALNKLYTASKTESRAGFPHFRKAAGGEAAHEKG